MSWNPFRRIRKNRQLPNAEQSEVHEIGVKDIIDNSDKKSIDWDGELPALIKPSIKNFRMCYEKSEIVKGIVEDLVIKSISGWVFEGDNAEAREYIKSEDERLDFMSLFHEVATNNIVDGAMFHNIVKKNGKLYLRELAFDGENYRIKELWDDETGSEIIGYKQKALKNKNTNKGWLKKKFADLNEELEEIEWDFLPNEVLASHFFERHGKYKSLLEPVLDNAYMIGLLERMMPQVVFKQTNTMIIHGGNKDRKEVKLKDNVVSKILGLVTNYHRKGAIYMPFGVDLELLGDTNLPKIQSYCDYLEKSVFKGLITPPSVFDGSSSNRSTAVVQLDSDKSGRVLFQQFLQSKLARWAQEVINILLEMRGYPKNCVKVNFNPETEETDETLNENGNVSTSKSGDGLNIDHIEDTSRGEAGATA